MAAVKSVTLVVAPRVEVTVVAPVFASIDTVWKPFCDRTGPLNVVFAMILPYMQVGVFFLHVVSRDCKNTG